MSFSSGYSQCCNYTLDMQDSYGDGWNGASVNVIVNGSSQGLFSVPNGVPDALENIVVCAGQSVELIFNSGTYDDEITYSLSSPSGMVYSDGPNPAIGSAFSGVGNCSVSTCGGGPSDIADSNLESFFLLGNTSQINYIGCPGVLGVEDQTTLGADLSAGGNYSATAQFGTCGGNYGGAGEAWVDRQPVCVAWRGGGELGWPASQVTGLVIHLSFATVATSPFTFRPLTCCQ